MLKVEAAEKHNFENSVGQAPGKWQKEKVNRLKINQLTSQKVRYRYRLSNFYLCSKEDMGLLSMV